MKSTVLLLFACLALSFSVGCGGGDSSGPKTEADKAAEKQAEDAHAAHNAGD